MSTRASVRNGATRRTPKRKAVAAATRARPEAPVESAEPAEIDDWVEPEDDRSRLEEGEMEILLTGHAATHGSEDEDNWLIKSEEESWGER